jgi:hypothetical protein
MYYIGLDVHKRTIRRIKTLPRPWRVAMEATVFTGGINKERLHTADYSREMLAPNPGIDEALRSIKKGGEDGAALQPGLGNAHDQEIEGQCESRNASNRKETGGLPHGRRPWAAEFSGSGDK